MSEVEIQAKALIAAALIQHGKFDLTMVNQWGSNPLGHMGLAALRDAVDIIYRGLFNPK